MQSLSLKRMTDDTKQIYPPNDKKQKTEDKLLVTPLSSSTQETPSGSSPPLKSRSLKKIGSKTEKIGSTTEEKVIDTPLFQATFPEASNQVPQVNEKNIFNWKAVEKTCEDYLRQIDDPTSKVFKSSSLKEMLI